MRRRRRNSQTLDTIPMKRYEQFYKKTHLMFGQFLPSLPTHDLVLSLLHPQLMPPGKPNFQNAEH